MRSGLAPDPPASRVRGVKRLTPIEAGTMTNDDSVRSSSSKEQVEVATAEERLVQELRPLARVLLIQARRELARRAREAQTKVA